MKYDIEREKFTELLMQRLNEQKIHDVITGHIQIEILFNEIIKELFPKSDKIINNNFGFIQKWHIIQSLDIIPSESIRQKIKLINNIRNGIAHELNYSFKKVDIDNLKIGMEKYQNKIKFDQELVYHNINYIVGYLKGLIDIIKEKNIKFDNSLICKGKNDNTIRTSAGRKLVKTT